MTEESFESRIKFILKRDYNEENIRASQVSIIGKT
jgi:hypothetical protein